MYIFHQIWGVFRCYFFEKFSLPHCLSSSLRLQLYILYYYILDKYLWILSRGSWVSVSFSLYSFSLLSSWIISIALPPSSLALSSLISILQWSPKHKLFISDTIFFSSRLSFFFLYSFYFCTEISYLFIHCVYIFLCVPEYFYNCFKILVC